MRSTLLYFCFVVALNIKGSKSAPYNAVVDVDYITCNQSITEKKITKEDPSHDACCCHEDEDEDTCKSYRKSSHVCTFGNIKSLVTKENRMKEENRFGVCGSGSFLRNYMFCNSSTGEVVLITDATFRSQKLCKNQLPKGPDRGPAIRLHNKEVHIEGRVNKIFVDVSATFLFIDLLPFKISSDQHQFPGQLKLQVKVKLPASGECTTLNKVQNYMENKTLDIWVSKSYARFSEAKKYPILSIPEESAYHWMMISQRAFQ